MKRAAPVELKRPQVPEELKPFLRELAGILVADHLRREQERRHQRDASKQDHTE
jgi:hypothetical protein